MQAYSDPSRASDQYSLPDVEYWKDPEDCKWWFWFCFPGCLPDSDASGPYDTEAECIEAFQDLE